MLQHTLGRRTLVILASCALVAFTVLCGVLAMAVIDVNTRVAGTVGKLDNELDEMHRLTLEAGLTAMEARKASKKEETALDNYNLQIGKIFDDVHTAMLAVTVTVSSIKPVADAATDTLKTTQQTVQALQAPINQANTTLAALQPVIAHTDALVMDPAITGTITNVENATAHLNATAADVQAEVHSITHPTLLHKIWGGLLDVAHVFNPL